MRCFLDFGLADGGDGLRECRRSAVGLERDGRAFSVLTDDEVVGGAGLTVGLERGGPTFSVLTTTSVVALLEEEVGGWAALSLGLGRLDEGSALSSLLA